MKEVLHLTSSVQRHSLIPYLWRSRCHCGANFLAPNETAARTALNQHIAAEEPFPDLGITPEPGSGAANVQEGSEKK